MSNSDKIIKPELSWPDKHLSEPISLPFQTIETINDHIIKEQNDPWNNRLIWGENYLVMSSLLNEFAGKIQLIYIDPPFATGQDFSYTVNIGDHTEATKMPSALEIKAYRDTWGKGIESYLQMMYSRLFLMKELLTDSGSICVHLDATVGHYVKVIMDEIFGGSNFLNHITWKRYAAHSLSTERYDTVSDFILIYSKNSSFVKFKPQLQQLDDEEIEMRFPHIEIETGRKYQHVALEQSSNRSSRGEVRKIQEREVTSNIGWRWSQETFDERLKNNPYLIHWTKTGKPRYKIYSDEYMGKPIGDVWDDIQYLSSGIYERTGFPTQKPEALLERVIKASTNEGDIVADFFCGSGTAGVAAENLCRRWIMADLGRFAIHTSRKRLLDINAKPFIVQNLGKYERQHWVKMNGRYTGYLKFIIELYNGDVSEDIIQQFRQTFRSLHGKKGSEYIHVGNVDAPITLSEIREALEECKENNISKLVVLGWEWQLGLHELVHEEVRPFGVKLRLLQIPREVMELSANDLKKHEIQFFELASLETNTKVVNKNITITLTDFIIPHPDLLPIEVKDKISNWSDYIDYWSIDWMSNQRNSTNKTIFHNMDQEYRTRKNSILNLSMNHVYDKVGNYQILVKVIDIFGNDTTKMIEVTVL